MATKKSRSFGSMISEFFGGKAKHTKSKAAHATPAKRNTSKASKSRAKKA
ncbi:MAG: hypothetical protein P4L31_03485 [Candidatus Babeliales bacterium]|nr:hypothetical protein [Candidatus Babeliales bacterium]